MVIINQRVIVNGSKGVVKYYGSLEDTTGNWVGIDWDKENRGKHDGTYKKRRYFTASAGTSGSFLREENLDFGTDLIAEVTDKYADDIETESGAVSKNRNEIHWEFVKMDKIHQKQKDVFNLKCIVLSWSRVSHLNLDGITFGACTELDLTDTLIGKWIPLLDVMSAFPVLKVLRLNDNRIEPLEECSEAELQRLNESRELFGNISHLSLNRCRLSEFTANRLTSIFTNLEEIYIAENALSNYSPPASSASNLRLLDLQGNPIRQIQRLESVGNFPRLEHLNLASCNITNIDFTLIKIGDNFSNLRTLILQNNPITRWKSIEELAKLGSLRKLILKGVPLSGARGVDSREMIIAKIPQIVDLDKCDISPVARRSAELLFLSRFSVPPLDEEHQGTVERLKAVYYEPNADENGTENQSSHRPMLSGIQSRRIFLVHKNRSVERTLSLALPIHKVVGLGARLLGFDPDQIKGIELHRLDPSYPAELISRTKDNLLRQFELEDGDTLVFV